MTKPPRVKREPRHQQTCSGGPMARPKGTCSIAGCDSPHWGRSWCQKHYSRWLKHGTPTWEPLRGRQPRPILDRILDHLEIDPRQGCWWYQGRLDSKKYGRASTGSRTAGTRREVAVHRFMYELYIGPIPLDRPQVDHMCHNDDPDCPGALDCMHRRCCNPDHLVPATNQENNQRGHDRKKRRSE